MNSGGRHRLFDWLIKGDKSEAYALPYRNTRVDHGPTICCPVTQRWMGQYSWAILSEALREQYLVADRPYPCQPRRGTSDD